MLAVISTDGVQIVLFIEIINTNIRRSVTVMLIGNKIKIISLFFLSVLVTACAKNAEKSSEQGKQSKTVVRFATNAGNLPINFGIQKGYFAKEGIDLKVVTISGGVEAVTQGLTVRWHT